MNKYYYRTEKRQLYIKVGKRQVFDLFLQSRYVFMKLIPIICTFFLAIAECHALFIENECDNKADIEKFSKLYEIKIEEFKFENNEIHQAWMIKIPAKYRKYKFDTMFLTLNQDKKEVLSTYIETHRENGYILGYAQVHKDLGKNIKVHAEFNENPDLNIIDGPICKFELSKKHNKAAHRDALPLTSFAALGAHGLKRYASKR